MLKRVVRFVLAGVRPSKSENLQPVRDALHPKLIVGMSSADQRPNCTAVLGAVRHLINGRGAVRAWEMLEIVAKAELSPIAADHIRVAEALMLDSDYAGGLTAARVTVALRDITPKQTAEAKEVAFAKRLPVWRAFAAVVYRAHAAPKRSRAKVAEAGTVAPVSAVAPSAPARAATAGTKTHIPGAGDMPTSALAAGNAALRRGDAWPAAWGVAPDHPECTVPGLFLGDVATIASTKR